MTRSAISKKVAVRAKVWLLPAVPVRDGSAAEETESLAGAAAGFDADLRPFDLDIIKTQNAPN